VKIVIPERKQKNQEYIISRQQTSVLDPRACNYDLFDRLETLSRSKSTSSSCQMFLWSEIKMSCSDQEISFYPTHFDVIEETDGDCKMFCDEFIEDLKRTDSMWICRSC
jgi:hypothetical protein